MHPTTVTAAHSRRMGFLAGFCLLVVVGLPIGFCTAVTAGASAATAALPSGGAQAAKGGPSAASYAGAVTRICAGALLFDHAHHMGTRADALSVASDIRASTARRLARVAALPLPLELRQISTRWISSQRRLADSYARTWIRIYDTIDAARTPTQRATLAQRLHRLVHVPDPLRAAAVGLEHELDVPDCTGGGPSASSASPSAPSA